MPETAGNNTIGQFIYQTFRHKIELDGSVGDADFSAEVIQTNETEANPFLLVRGGRFNDFIPEGRYFKSQEQVIKCWEQLPPLISGHHMDALSPFSIGDEVFVVHTRKISACFVYTRIYSIKSDKPWGAYECIVLLTEP